MVSKIAVTALVIIVAAPILLGYAFNLSEVSITDFKPDGDPVNVTPILKNDTAYTDVSADTFSINTKFDLHGLPVRPLYSVSESVSSLPMESVDFEAGDYYQSPFKYANYSYFFFKSNGDGNGKIAFNLIKAADNTIFATYDNICTWNWDAETQLVTFTYFNEDKTAISNADAFGVNDPNYWGFMFTVSADYSSTGYAERMLVTGEDSYVDFSQGYRFPHPVEFIVMKLPEKTKSVLMTMNLSSIQATSYQIRLMPVYNGPLDMEITKTTVNGVSTWSVVNRANSDVIADSLYMDPLRADNTYQIIMSIENTENNNWKYHVEFRYVGSWPILIGSANYYQKYEYDYNFTSSSDMSMYRLLFGGSTPIYDTPVIRLDSAVYAGFAYDIIQDKTYTPADFKINPITTIEVEKLGTSIQFGGNTYNVVSGGYIMMGTHKIPLDGMKFQSIPIEGGYENRINGTTVSETAQPSTITFNGKWGMSVSTESCVSYTYTKTEWNSGEFAWNGLDQNFLMVGLLAALGTFIALGIAYRRAKSALWALLIVCGGAILLFFVML